MSFSSLPTELVHQIIESTVPHTFHSTTYNERQRTLSRLSLVSKQFHSIAQPLLFEIVRLRRVEDAEKLLTPRASRESVSSHRILRWVIMDWDETWHGEETQEEEDRFAESLRIFETVRNLTFQHIDPSIVHKTLSMTSAHLTSLQLSNLYSMTPEGIYLPNLRDLALTAAYRGPFSALVDPKTVPNLRNFALLNSDPFYAGHLKLSSFQQLVPQLHTLTIAVAVWSDPLSASLHRVASETWVDFDSYHTSVPPSTAILQHIRFKFSSVNASLFSHEELQVHLDRWSTFIQENSSLPLKSIYLDSSLDSFDALSPATRLCLEHLTRVCQERKIDLIFEASPVNFSLDPYISEEFIRRQGQQRRKEAEGREEIGG